MFERPQLQALLARLAEPPKFIQILAGPRQVGKTTLITQAEKRLGPGRMLYAAADLPAAPNADWIVQQWQRAQMAARQLQGASFVLALDEIQKVPRWSETIKGLWDSRPDNLHLVLLGSAQFLVQQGLTESLAGRFELIRLPHWSFTEMRKAFDLTWEDYVLFGGYPGPAGLTQQPERWVRYVQDSIIEPIISKDVLSLGRIDKPALMRRLMQLGSMYSGQVLSYQKMIGQLQDVGNTTTLAHYLQLLSFAGMLTGLNKYAADQARSRASSPKFQVFDSALQTSLLGQSLPTLRDNTELWGRLVESAVGAHLLNSTAPGVTVGYWRDRHKEVDFILSTPSACLAIEVKSGRQSRGLPGLDAFTKQFPNSRGLLVGTGGVPIEDFLSQPAQHWFDLLTSSRGRPV
jgi:uncharacterized protein